jgi:hypothetical protein
LSSYGVSYIALRWQSLLTALRCKAIIKALGGDKALEVCLFTHLGSSRVAFRCLAKCNLIVVLCNVSLLEIILIRLPAFLLLDPLFLAYSLLNNTFVIHKHVSYVN